MARPPRTFRRFSRSTYAPFALEQERGVGVFEALSQDADNNYVMIDSSIVRAHQHSAGAKKGGRRETGHRT